MYSGGTANWNIKGKGLAWQLEWQFLANKSTFQRAALIYPLDSSWTLNDFFSPSVHSPLWMCEVVCVFLQANKTLSEQSSLS